MSYDFAEEVAPMFHDTFNSHKMHQIDKGGRGSTKTSKNDNKIWKDILENPGTNVVVVRRYAKDNRGSTFRELKRAASRLGIKLESRKHLWYSPLEIRWKDEATKKTSHIYFAGLDDYESLKGMIPDEDTINIIWFFEASQYRGDFDMQQVIATFSRGKPKYFYCLYEFNPHPNLSHWSYDWLKKMEKRDDAHIRHTTYEDLPQELQDEWLGDVFIKEAQAIKALDYEQYKSIYLGLPARLKGAIYKRFNMALYNHQLVYSDIFYSIGVDYGETDATVFTHTGFGSNMRSVNVHAEWYHKNKGVDQKDINDYADGFFEFASHCHEQHGKPMIVFVDSASKSFYTLLNNEARRRRVKYLDIRKVNKTKKTKNQKGAIQERIDLTNLMYGCEGYLNIDEGCKNLLMAFETVEYNDRGDRIDDGSYNIDSLDSFEYSWLEWYKEIEQGIIHTKGVL